MSLRNALVLVASLTLGASVASAATINTNVKRLRDLLNSEVQAPLAHTKAVATQSDKPEAMLAEYIAVVHSRTPFHVFKFAADPAEVKTGHTYGTLAGADEVTAIIDQAQGFDGAPYKHEAEAKAILADLAADGAQFGYDAAGRSDNGSPEVLILVVDTQQQQVYSIETYPLVD